MPFCDLLLIFLNKLRAYILSPSAIEALQSHEMWVNIRTSLLSCTFSISYPSSSSISSGSLTTTEPPQPLMQLTRATSVQIHPRFAHCTSLIGPGLEAHRSTRRNVSRRSRNRSRSQGTKVGRAVVEGEVVLLADPESLRMELRTDARSEVSLLLSRTFFIERLAGMRSWAAVVDGFGALSVVRGFEMDSSTRWNLRFLDSTAYDISGSCCQSNAVNAVAREADAPRSCTAQTKIRMPQARISAHLVASGLFNLKAKSLVTSSMNSPFCPPVSFPASNSQHKPTHPQRPLY